jgi:prepilin-type N-terminal cleavage/methylation domain-containing protein
MKTRGYTAVEVMLSIAVLAVGSAGVMAMQKAAVLGNNDARMTDMANSIARQWIERLRWDANFWSQGQGATQVLAANWANQTFFISSVGANPGTWMLACGPGWARPCSFANGGANSNVLGPAADILGRDVAATGGSYPGAVFCTDIKGDWLVSNELMRVTVRVYWLKQMYTKPGAAFCTQTNTQSPGLPDGADASQVYHFVYATTLLKKNTST